MFALLAVLSLVAGAPHVTLDLSYSADSATVPTRAALVAVPLGTPPRRRRLLLDFASQDIEIDGCHRTDSYSFAEQLQTDEVLFDAEHLTDSQPQTATRLPVLDHCNATGALSPRFYANCVGSRCEGVFGLDRASALWSLYSSYSLSLDALRLGRSHPRAVPAGVRVSCIGDAGGMCAFRALLQIPGQTRPLPVTVDLHLDNSYTRVPAVALGAARLQLLADDGSGALLLELDDELVEHQPSRLHAHSSSLQGAAGAFFGTYARTRASSLLKPTADESRVELGNAVLLRYAFHVDLLHDQMRIERRAVYEHVPLLDVLVAATLFGVLVRASLYAATAPLQAFGVGTPTATRGPGFALLALVVAVVYVPARAHAFVDTPFDFVWLNVALALNIALASVARSGSAARAVAVETSLALALLQLASVTRTESLGGVGGVALALLAALLVLRYAYALLASLGGGGALFVVATLANALVVLPLLAWRVVYAYNHSAALTALLFSLSLLAAGASVDAYAALAVAEAK